MPLRQRQGLLAGLALLAAGSVILEIALTRVWSAEIGRHVAVPAASLPLLGAGLGGVLLYVFPTLARPPVLLARLANLAALAAAATVVALLVTVHTPPVQTLDSTVIGRLAAIYLTGALPFVISGIAVAVTVRYGPRDFGRLGAALFVGAGLGGVGALAVLRAGGLRAGLVVALIDALAALAFYVAAAASPASVRRPRGATIATAVLAASVLLAGDLGAPWLKLPHMRWSPLDKTEMQAWNEIGLVTVDKAARGTALIHTDGADGMPILEAKGTPPTTADEMAYLLARDQGPVLVLAAGGGHDVRMALKYGQREIYVVEPNPAVARTVMRDKYRTYSGDLYDKPEVHVALDDPRAWLRGSSLRFRNIVLALPDTQRAQVIGALAAAESPLYTVEALRDDLGSLTPEGTLVVSRWEGDLDRVLALASEALRRVGEAEPARHLFACGGPHGTSVLVRRLPLGDREIAVLRDHCRKNKLNEGFAPDNPHTDLRARLTTTRDLRAVAPLAAVDVLPPTDDRPFFFDPVPPGRFVQTLGTLTGLAEANQAILVVAGLAAFGSVVLVLALFASLLHRRAPVGISLPLLYFAALGAGAAFASAALTARLGALLGQPGFQLTTVLLTLMLYAGAGSARGGRVPLLLAEASAGYRAQILVGGLAVAAAGLGPLVEAAFGLPFGARVAVTIVVLAPFGLLLGSLVSLGVRLVATRSPEILPWCWGVGALAAFVALPVGWLAAMNLGWTAVLLVGGACFLVAAAAAPRAPYRVRG